MEVHPVLHKAREVDDHLRVSEIASLRHVRHQQVVPHDEDASLDALRRETEALEALARQRGALVRMVAAAPLPDVVEQTP